MKKANKGLGKADKVNAVPAHVVGGSDKKTIHNTKRLKIKVCVLV